MTSTNEAFPHPYKDLTTWECAKLDATRAMGHRANRELIYLCTDDDAQALIKDIQHQGGSLQYPRMYEDPNYLGQWEGVVIERGADISHFSARYWEPKDTAEEHPDPKVQVSVTLECPQSLLREHGVGLATPRLIRFLGLNEVSIVGVKLVGAIPEHVSLAADLLLRASLAKRNPPPSP